jgi:hypothetical protein
VVVMPGRVVLGAIGEVDDVTPAPNVVTVKPGLS